MPKLNRQYNYHYQQIGTLDGLVMYHSQEQLGLLLLG